MELIVLLGRILFSALFIMASLGHFSQPTIDFAASQGVPMASILVPVSGLIALIGGVSVLIGYKTRYGAWLLVIFLVPVTFMIHKFWAISDPVEAGIEQIMFMKNLSLIGAALLIAYFGPGPLSIDKSVDRN